MPRSLRVFFITVFLSLLSCEHVIAAFWTIPESLNNVCALIMAGESPEGTGFIVFVKDRDIIFSYLITARHVAKKVSAIDPKNWKIHLSRVDSSCAEVLEFPAVFHDGQTWLEHENPSVDIAAIRAPIAERYKEFGVRYIVLEDASSEWFATRECLRKYSVRQGDQVFTLGLIPWLFTKGERNLIMTRFGNISMLPLNEIEIPGGRQRTYFTDCAAFPGNSGSPCFVLLERNAEGVMDGTWRFALLGVVTELVPSILRTKEISLEGQRKKQKG